MADPYQEVNNLEKQNNAYLDKAMQTNQDIINKQTQMNIDTLQRQKDEIDKNATQQNKALYNEYKQASNPWGANAEQLASRGLGNSGYAETTQTNLYNTYQKNVTDTLNNARKLKSDFDFQMSQARQNGDIAMAQNALELYKQRMQLGTQMYELRNNREQFLYQQNRDKVADNQWQKQFDYNKYINDRNYNYQADRDNRSDMYRDQEFAYQQAIDDRNYNYQRERDKVGDSQWQKEYELSKKAKATSSRRSSGGRRRSSGGSSGGYVISTIDDTSNSNNNSSNTSELGNNLMSVLNMVKGSNPNGYINKIGTSTIEQLYKNGQINDEEREYLLNEIKNK